MRIQMISPTHVVAIKPAVSPAAWQNLHTHEHPHTNTTLHAASIDFPLSSVLVWLGGEEGHWVVIGGTHRPARLPQASDRGG